MNRERKQIPTERSYKSFFQEREQRQGKHSLQTPPHVELHFGGEQGAKAEYSFPYNMLSGVITFTYIFFILFLKYIRRMKLQFNT